MGFWQSATSAGTFVRGRVWTVPLDIEIFFKKEAGSAEVHVGVALAEGGGQSCTIRDPRSSDAGSTTRRSEPSTPIVRRLYPSAPSSSEYQA